MDNSTTSSLPGPQRDDARPAGGGFVSSAESADAESPVAAPLDEKLLDEALQETFPASDPISPATPEAGTAAIPPQTATQPSPPRSNEPYPFPKSESTEPGPEHPQADDGDAGVASPS